MYLILTTASVSPTIPVQPFEPTDADQQAVSAPSLSTGTIVGIVVGCLAFLFVIVGLCLANMRVKAAEKEKKRKEFLDDSIFGPTYMNRLSVSSSEGSESTDNSHNIVVVA
jgi:hypothetical protein